MSDTSETFEDHISNAFDRCADALSWANVLEAMAGSGKPVSAGCVLVIGRELNNLMGRLNDDLEGMADRNADKQKGR